MDGNINACSSIAAWFLLGRRLGLCAQGFGFVEEQILLLSPPRFGLGGKQLAQACLQTFFEKADLNLQRTYLAAKILRMNLLSRSLSKSRSVRAKSS